MTNDDKIALWAATNAMFDALDTYAYAGAQYSYSRDGNFVELPGDAIAEALIKAGWTPPA